MKSTHDMQFGVFYFPKQKICAQRCGRTNLERMAIVEFILLKRVSAIHFLQFQRHKITENVWRQEKQYLGIPKNGYQVSFISVVNMNLFVWFMKAKVVVYLPRLDAG